MFPGFPSISIYLAVAWQRLLETAQHPDVEERLDAAPGK